MEKLYILWTHEEGKELINTQCMPKLEKKFQTVASRKVMDFIAYKSQWGKMVTLRRDGGQE
jgi:hypothetical protein